MSINLIYIFYFFIKFCRIYLSKMPKKRALLIARLDIVVFVVLRKQFYTLFFLITTIVTATAIDTHTTGTTTAIMILLR